MGRKHTNKLFTSVLALILVFSMILPSIVFADGGQSKHASDLKNEKLAERKAAIERQLSLSKGRPKLHESLKGISSDEELNVIVHLSEKPVALEQGIYELQGKHWNTSEKGKAKAKVDKQQKFVFGEMAGKKMKVKKGYTFDTVLNGFSMKVKGEDLKKLLSIEGVTLVEPDTTVYASEEFSKSGSAAVGTSNNYLGVDTLWNEGLEGQGVKVAVLDTGIDPMHPAFQGVYKGGKNFVVHDEKYARPRADNDPSETSPLDRAAGTPEKEGLTTFVTSHGTHVAGIIAANGNNAYGVKGAAPKVDLYAYRVLGAYGAGNSGSVLAAIEESVVQEMDIINLSLSGASNEENTAMSNAINNAAFAGVITVSSSGNNGPGRGTVGNPGSARLGITVGNTTNPTTVYDTQVVVKSGTFEVARNAQVIATTYGMDIERTLAGDFPLVAVPGVGQSEDYDGLEVTGKVVLVAHGQISVKEKIEIAFAKGATAVLLSSGTAASLLGEELKFVPTVALTKDEGDAIRAELLTAEGMVSFSSFHKTVLPGDDVNSSSSRGPTVPNFDIKPDVLAPGTDIMSTIAMYQADLPEVVYDYAYERKSGTSMATPYIAGIAALMKQAHPEWTQFDVKVALSNTAKVIDKQYDVFAQGAGRVQPIDAVHPTVLAYAKDQAILDSTGVVVDNLKGSMTFGPQSLANDLVVTKEILVKDKQGVGGDYRVSVEVTTPFADATVTVDQPVFTLNVAGEQLLTVTLTASKNLNTKANDELLGYIHITNSNTQTDISLPFAADFSQGAVEVPEIKDLHLSKTDLSFNGDGVNEETVLTTTIVGGLSFASFDLVDMFTFMPMMYSYEDYLESGRHELLIQSPFDFYGESMEIPDGVYSVEVSGIGDADFLMNSTGPLFVKSTAPIIEGTVNVKEVSGQIIDQYIDFNAGLAMFGERTFDLNEKLFATYTINGKQGSETAVPFQLAQDGSFSFRLGAFNPKFDTITVTVVDAAGNGAETVLEKSGGPGAINPNKPIPGKPDKPGKPVIEKPAPGKPNPEKPSY